MYLYVKRLFDFFISLVFLILLFPIFCLICLLIKLNSKGSVFFVQKRLGHNKKVFHMYKFRTMAENAELIKDKFYHLNEASFPAFKIKNDPRLTKIGKKLRKLGLDELPQLFNVFKGDMSFIGFRPPTLDEVRYYTKNQLKRFQGYPGIISIWVIRGNHILSFDEWINSDILYEKHKSLIFDFMILFEFSLFFLNNVIKLFFKKFDLIYYYNLFKLWIYDSFLIKFKTKKVGIESSSNCQLKCPVCPNTKGMIAKSTIGSGNLSFKNFKRFILQNPKIKKMELSNYGEPFLNKDIDNILKLSCEKKIKLMLKNGTNFNDVSKQTIENLVKYKFEFISISLDGITQKIYEKYRVGGNLNKVMNNLKLLLSYKKKYNSKFPIIQIQFILFNHNIKQYEKMKKFCLSNNILFKPKLNADSNYSVIHKKTNVDLNFTNRQDFYKKRKTYYNYPCMQLWTNPQINWDGKLLGCCCNKYGFFGNVFKQNFLEVLKSNSYKNIKKMILGFKQIDKDMPCYNCKRLKIVKESNKIFLQKLINNLRL